LDPFGWSAERRGERRFQDEYLSWVAIAVGHLTPATADAVRAVVDLANDVHGYAHVRRESIARVRVAAARQLAALAGSDQLPRVGSPVAL
jgi:indolepyruvate ferredoxin oxidoreductase